MTTSESSISNGVALELPVRRWLPITKTYAAFDGPFPSYVQFDDGDTRQVSSWRDLYGQVASWLALTGQLPDSVQYPADADKNLVGRDALNEDGTKFDRPYRLPNGLWIDVSGEERLQRDLAIVLLKQRNIDPSTVLVMLEHSP